MAVSNKTQIILSVILFSVASFIGGILAIERYSCLWPAFSHFEIWWKVYLDHFMAGFLIPIWAFIVYTGLFMLFHRTANIETQKKALFWSFIVVFAITIIWDFVIPLGYLILNKINFWIAIQVLNNLYNYPQWQFIQFIFDMAGIFCALLFVKFLRKDLE